MKFLRHLVAPALFLMTSAGPAAVHAQTAIDDNLSIAEAFVDAFYSFDRGRLEPILSAAPESTRRIVFYQGWAEGGNYEVLNRMPCVVDSAEVVRCSIMVRDDLIEALDVGFNVTDTFELTFVDGEIVSVRTSSNDPQAYHDARQWVRDNRPELIEEPCRGYFDGGPTPQACVRAMARGYAEFAASESIQNAP